MSSNKKLSSQYKGIHHKHLRKERKKSFKIVNLKRLDAYHNEVNSILFLHAYILQLWNGFPVLSNTGMYIHVPLIPFSRAFHFFTTLRECVDSYLKRF